MGGNSMKKILSITFVFALALSWIFVSAPLSPAQANVGNILQFNNMAGLPQELTGDQFPIRDMNGGGLPWMLTSANGVFSSNGNLVVNVRGLVFAAGPNEGSNTLPEFGVVVSCLNTDGSVNNFFGGAFPATTGPAIMGGGNSNIHARIALPETCIAPIIFITNGAGTAWFAITGK